MSIFGPSSGVAQIFWGYGFGLPQFGKDELDKERGKGYGTHFAVEVGGLLNANTDFSLSRSFPYLVKFPYLPLCQRRKGGFPQFGKDELDKKGGKGYGDHFAVEVRSFAWLAFVEYLPFISSLF